MTAKQATVLLIDDEPDMLDGFQRILRVAGHSVVTSSSPEQIEDLLKEHHPDAVLTDLRMPGLDGMGVLKAVMEHDRRIPVMILTAYGTIENAVDAVKVGAFDYLTKPIGKDALIGSVRRALAHHETHQSASQTPEEEGVHFHCDGLVGESEAMKDVVRLLRKVARTDASVLITGDSGTGKEVAARCLHASSHRRSQPFIPIDCASLPESLLESELFGHEKGSFTGAIAQKPGVFELASGGTVLLDEIGEMGLPLQAKLLRVVQERCFRRIGGRSEIHVDVRILSATNRDLTKTCDEGGFRSDLFFRLNVITVDLPPLRNRDGDVPRLAQHFFERFMRSTDKRLDTFSREAMACLEAFTWPGNVRQLQNVVERAVVLSDGPMITPDDLPAEIRGSSPATTVVSSSPPSVMNGARFHQAKHELVDNFEREYLVEVLQRSGGNVSQAAAEAGINRRTLYRLIEKFSIDIANIRR